MLQQAWTVETLKEVLAQDEQMSFLLQVVADLQLQDSWLCAGRVRNFIWNLLSDKPGFDDQTDVDVIFYDPSISQEETMAMEKELIQRYPEYQWELKNQVAMHHHSPHTMPYQNSCDAMSKYPETCTAIGVRLSQGAIEVFCPYGLEAITSFTVKPTPHFLEHADRMALYHQRLAKKNWRKKWPRLVLEET